MTATNLVSEQEYRRIALADPDGLWELHRGRLRGKPAMSVEHNDVTFHLGFLLQSRLDRRQFKVRVNAPRVRRSAENYYLPDVAVVPTALERPLRERPGTLDAYADPLPLVVEVWSPSTGDYDIGEKLAEYQIRGDAEIWRIHPYDRTLTAWRRQPDGGYAETTYHAGVVRADSLPNIAIDLDAPLDS